jgi:hypothetical protein
MEPCCEFRLGRLVVSSDTSYNRSQNIVNERGDLSMCGDGLGEPHHVGKGGVALLNLLNLYVERLAENGFVNPAEALRRRLEIHWDAKRGQHSPEHRMLVDDVRDAPHHKHGFAVAVTLVFDAEGYVQNVPGGVIVVGRDQPCILHFDNGRPVWAFAGKFVDARSPHRNTRRERKLRRR